MPLELLGMGALLVAEAPHSTPKYRWLAALYYAYSWLVFFVPKLPIVFVHMLYLVLSVSIWHYRLLAGAKTPESD